MKTNVDSRTSVLERGLTLPKAGRLAGSLIPKSDRKNTCAPPPCETIQLGPRKQREVTSLNKVLKYSNNAVIARIAQELKLSEKEAKKLFRDTLKFLWLAAKFGGVVPSPFIDEGWHTFILFTADYQKFCQDHFSVFLHHRPRRPEDKPDGGKLRARTHMLIKEYLGDNLGSNWDYKKLARNDCEQSCAPSRDCNGG